MKKRPTAPSTVKQAFLSSHNENEDSKFGAEREDKHKLPHESSEDKSTCSSLDMGGGQGTIPSIRVTSQDREAQATPTASKSPNLLNQLNRQETTPTHSQLNQSNGSIQLNGQAISEENGSSTGAAALRGHLFTEEEVQSLQRQIADLQVDLEQLLQYTHVS